MGRRLLVILGILARGILGRPACACAGRRTKSSPAAPVPVPAEPSAQDSIPEDLRLPPAPRSVTKTTWATCVPMPNLPLKQRLTQPNPNRQRPRQRVSRQSRASRRERSMPDLRVCSRRRSPPGLSSTPLAFAPTPALCVPRPRRRSARSPDGGVGPRRCGLGCRRGCAPARKAIGRGDRRRASARKHESQPGSDAQAHRPEHRRV